MLIAIIFSFAGCNSNSKETQKDISGDGKGNKITGSAIDDGIKNGTSEEKAQAPTHKAEDFVLKNGTIKTDVCDSKAISQNLIKEETKHNLFIYLPPTYNESDKKYPVIYFLHGFGDSPSDFISNSQSELDQAFSKDPSKEFILVAVDGRNSSGGSFYVNSPVTGKWDDYTSKEVVSYIDSSYRTIASANSRGICGFSMGGFGALNLAFLHPDIYGAVFSMSPGVLAPGKIGDALDSWEYDSGFLKSYSQAFAYNTKSPYDTTPTRDGSNKDNKLLKRWESGFGNWKEKVEAYMKLRTPLKAIGLIYGTSDSYKWIPEGTEYLSGLLDEKGIKHTLTSIQGGHNIPYEAMTTYIIPFFQDSIEWE